MASEHKGATMQQPKRNAAETRDRLLRAARKLFARASYGSVGIRESGAEAGVNPALISRYFGSKRKLFLEVADTLYAEGTADLPDAPPQERASIAMGCILTGGAKSTWATDFRITALSALDPSVSDVMTQTHDKIRKAIMATLPGEHATTRAELILAQLLGASMVVNLLRSADSPRIDIEYMKGFYARQLAKLFADNPPD